MFQYYLSIPPSPPQRGGTESLALGRLTATCPPFHGPWAVLTLPVWRRHLPPWSRDACVYRSWQLLPAGSAPQAHTPHSAPHPPPQNSSQVRLVFLTGDHVPPLRATVISQGRQLSRQSIPIHLDKRWATQSHVWSCIFFGVNVQRPGKGSAPLGYHTEHHSAQRRISRVGTVFPARQALPEGSHRCLTPRLRVLHTQALYINSSIHQNSSTHVRNEAPGFEMDRTPHMCQVLQQVHIYPIIN